MTRIVSVDTVWTEVPGPWPSDETTMALPTEAWRGLGVGRPRGTHWIFTVIDVDGGGQTVEITEATLDGGALVERTTVRLPRTGLDALIQFVGDVG